LQVFVKMLGVLSFLRPPELAGPRLAKNAAFPSAHGGKAFPMPRGSRKGACAAGCSVAAQARGLSRKRGLKGWHVAVPALRASPYVRMPVGHFPGPAPSLRRCLRQPASQALPLVIVNGCAGAYVVLGLLRKSFLTGKRNAVAFFSLDARLLWWVMWPEQGLCGDSAANGERFSSCLDIGCFLLIWVACRLPAIKAGRCDKSYSIAVWVHAGVRKSPFFL